MHHGVEHRLLKTATLSNRKSQFAAFNKFPSTNKSGMLHRKGSCLLGHSTVPFVTVSSVNLQLANEKSG